VLCIKVQWATPDGDRRRTWSQSDKARDSYLDVSRQREASVCSNDVSPNTRHVEHLDQARDTAL